MSYFFTPIHHRLFTNVSLARASILSWASCLWTISLKKSKEIKLEDLDEISRDRKNKDEKEDKKISLHTLKSWCVGMTQFWYKGKMIPFHHLLKYNSLVKVVALHCPPPHPSTHTPFPSKLSFLFAKCFVDYKTYFWHQEGQCSLHHYHPTHLKTFDL